MKFPRVLMITLGLLATLWLGAAQALPTVDEVQAATQRGDYVGAESLMREVVAAKPGSAKGHYLLAEILAHQRKFGEARDHATQARAIDPAIKFTDPTKFSAFERLLDRERQLSTAPSQGSMRAAPMQAQAPRAEAAPASGGVPVWVLIGGAVLFIAVAAAWMRRRAPAPMMNAGPAYAGGAPVGGAPGGYGPGGYGPGGYGPASSGPGLMGVGLAAAGGVAAGMLAEKLMHGDRDAGSSHRGGDALSGGDGGYGGFDSNAGAQAGAARDLENRNMDFGTGNGWDSGGADAGGDGGDGGGGDW